MREFRSNKKKHLVTNQNDCRWRWLNIDKRSLNFRKTINAYIAPACSSYHWLGFQMWVTTFSHFLPFLIGPLSKTNHIRDGESQIMAPRNVTLHQTVAMEWGLLSSVDIVTATLWPLWNTIRYQITIGFVIAHKSWFSHMHFPLN